MNRPKQNEFVANGGWVEKKFCHKPRALLCLRIGVVLLIPVISLCLSLEVGIRWLGFALVLFAVLFGSFSIRLFYRETPKEIILVSNAGADLRKLY